MLTNQLTTGMNLEALLLYDPDLFSGLSVPAGMDVQQAVAIIRRLHGLAPLYHPDPYWLKNEIIIWSRQNLPIWTKLYRTTQLDYNPIWNTDATETVTDTTSLKRRTADQGTNTGHTETEQTSDHAGKADGWNTGDGTEHTETVGTTTEDTKGTSTEDATGTSHTDTTGNQHTVSDGTEKTETENKVSAYNTDTYQPESYSTVNGETHTDTTTDSTGVQDGKTTGHTEGQTTGHMDGKTTGQSDTATHTEGKYGNTDSTHETGRGKSKTRGETWQQGREDADTVYKHEWRRQGNIGVTTTQQMIAEERESVLYDMYVTIAASFHNTFCLDLY